MSPAALMNPVSDSGSAPVTQFTGRPVKTACVSSVRTEMAPHVPYFFSRPAAEIPLRGTIISIHGITRNSAAHAFHMARAAGPSGYCVIAPHFSKTEYSGYQLAQANAAGRDASQALKLVLADASLRFGIPTQSPILCGYSGGGQFAHRFVLTQDVAVRQLILIAPGWFTFPDSNEPFPYGLAPQANGMPGAPGLDRLLRTPISVIVGTSDIRRNGTLNTDPRLDARQGRNRLARASAWVEAINASAEERCLEPAATLVTVKKADHNFDTNFRRHGFAGRILDLIHKQHQPNPKT
ncbi:hypothetical protein [uncultured Maricaulis sp.]|uniref:hypothetical protein n=1 Tax=uncultured Maricaulis sp. TaxID=174710 RepID=UPI0030DAF538|tara:strand:- start:20435 stop:21319 length:885 start_codon:yes stop_codon:yes gene_type:complete